MTADYDRIKWQCKHVKLAQAEVWGEVLCMTDGGLVISEGCEPCVRSIHEKMLALKGGGADTVKLRILDQPSQD